MPSSDATTPFYSSTFMAFAADDTLVEIVPAFDLDRSIPLFSVGGLEEQGVANKRADKSSSSSSQSAPASFMFGPVRAGVSTTVPLWLAALLGEKSLAKIVLPSWMESDHLVKILQEERRSASLVGSTKILSSTTMDDDNSLNSSSTTTNPMGLPFYYYEISQRLSKLPSSAVSWNKAEVSLLIEDLCQIRVDKLRHTFQASMANLSTDARAALMARSMDLDARSSASLRSSHSHPPLLPDTFADVSGMAATELALLGPFFIQALNDVSHKLEGRSSTTRNKSNNMGDDDNEDNSQQEAPSSSSRRGDGAGNSQSPTARPTPPRRRDRLRRFR